MMQQKKTPMKSLKIHFVMLSIGWLFHVLVMVRVNPAERLGCLGLRNNTRVF
jgi:hypothetical protein